MQGLAGRKELGLIAVWVSSFLGYHILVAGINGVGVWLEGEEGLSTWDGGDSLR